MEGGKGDKAFSFVPEYFSAKKKMCFLGICFLGERAVVRFPARVLREWCFFFQLSPISDICKLLHQIGRFSNIFGGFFWG